jgi:hypothetical protein
MGTKSDIGDERYHSESDTETFDIGLKVVESDIMSDIGVSFLPISNILNPNLLFYCMSTFMLMKDEHEHEYELLDIRLSNIGSAQYRNRLQYRYRI